MQAKDFRIRQFPPGGGPAESGGYLMFKLTAHS